MTNPITANNLTDLYRDMVTELLDEPEFQFGGGRVTHATDAAGQPNVIVAAGNVPLDYDLWEGLRNPATIGNYPAGLREIWEFYANRKKERVDETGRRTIFQIPRSFELARQTYSRVVILSAMLPFSPAVTREHEAAVRQRGESATHRFCRMYRHVSDLLDRATARAGMALVAKNRVVVPMHNEHVKALSKEAIPTTRQGASHGPAKGGNYPQKSIAYLLGLGQFGVSRILFRDEPDGNGVVRHCGSLRSIVIFDQEDPVRDGSGGLLYPTPAWREFLLSLADFTNADPDVNRYRFCPYIPLDDAGCGKCIGCCPSGAQRYSTPTTRGEYAEAVAIQSHRFWEGKLQFDNERCCDDRGQMASLFDEWACARCISSCVAEGNSRPAAIRAFYDKMRELAM